MLELGVLQGIERQLSANSGIFRLLWPVRLQWHLPLLPGDSF